MINKTFKKRRTSLLEIDKNFTSEYVLKSLLKKNYLNIKTMRKGLSFNEENRIYYSDNINKFQNIYNVIVHEKTDYYKKL